MSFEENIQQWVATDNLIKSHNIMTFLNKFVMIVTKKKYEVNY